MNSSLRILYLEDSAADAELARDTLEMGGLACDVTRVETESGFLAALQQEGIDLILADYSLPSFDGLSALSITLQQRPDLPFIFVSGTMGEEVAVEALKIGATDYVLKTRMSRLVPSVRRALREANETAELRRAERELQDREVKIRRLVEANIVGIFTWDLEGRILEANDAFLRIVGYHREDLASGRLRWTDLTPREWLELDTRQRVPELMTTGRLQPFEKEYFRKDGSRVPVLVAVALFEEGGNEGVAFALDLSGQKRAEQALRRSESYLAEAQRLTHTGSCAIDGTSRETVYWSEEMFRLFGFDPQQGLPMWDQWLQRVHPGDRDQVKMAGDRTFLKKVDCDVEFRIVQSDGTFKHVHAVGHPVLSPNGELVQVVGTMVDITERTRAEEALRRSESYLAQAQRLAHIGSWAWQIPGMNPLYFSDEWYRIYDFDPKDGMPSWEQRLQRIHPDDRARYQAAVNRAVAEKSGYDVEFRILPPHSPVRFIHSVGQPVLSPSGELLQFVGVAMDVTASRRAEEERERLREQLAHLAHLNRVSTMGELTASLAHEINQPIGAAVTNAQACSRFLNRDQPDVPEAREAALETVRDARRAADIIARVRSLYQKGSSKLEIVDVNELIREMVVMLHNEANRNSVTMRTELGEPLPHVMADRVQLQQVLMNLMLNGIEAMRDTTGELSIKSRLDEGGQLLISVSDTGVGLPTGKADEIFKAFFTTKPQGTGLGLAITRSIVESHGGRVWATANSGRGATFHFTLPQKAAAHA
jgi:PAS domain S-box-containing protein